MSQNSYSPCLNVCFTVLLLTMRLKPSLTLTSVFLKRKKVLAIKLRDVKHSYIWSGSAQTYFCETIQWKVFGDQFLECYCENFVFSALLMWYCEYEKNITIHNLRVNKLSTLSYFLRFEFNYSWSWWCRSHVRDSHFTDFQLEPRRRILCYKIKSVMRKWTQHLSTL